jgi:hypothetical protein
MLASNGTLRYYPAELTAKQVFCLSHRLPA